MSDHKKCTGALAAARAYVLKDAPYVSSILMGFVPYVHEGLGTLGVSKGMVLIIDPDWFPTLPIEERAGCLMHEILHVQFGLDRIEAMPDKELANIAFDLGNNTYLRNAGWKLPDFALYPETFGLPEGLTGERYYELLEKKASSSSLKDMLSRATKNQGDGGKHAGNSVGAGKCGSCAGNGFDGIEEQIDREVGRGELDRQQIRRAGLEELAQAVKSGTMGRGNSPGMFEQLIASYAQEQRRIVPWRRRLVTVVRRTTGRIVSGRTDYSYKRPSKRSFLRGRVLPGMIDRKPVVAFVEDSSGSMGTEQLVESRVQIADCMTQLGINQAWWIEADAAVHSTRMISMRDIKSIPVKGRGGTDFRPAIAHALKLRPRPDILFYATDGDGTAPIHPPIGMEVIWCVVPSYYNQRPAEWGHTVLISDEPQYHYPA